MRRLISLMIAVVLCLSLAVVPVMAEPRTVKLSPQKFMVNGQNVDCEKYNIDGSNYFKLRDLAMVLNGTSKQFSVGWDAASRTVSIETGKAYIPEGGELYAGSGQGQTAVVSTQTIMIDGVKVSDISVYNIGGNNYFKLRDLGSKVGFIVDYDEATNTAIVMSEGGGNAEEAQPKEEKPVTEPGSDGSITRAEFQEFLNYAQGCGYILKKGYKDLDGTYCTRLEASNTERYPIFEFSVTYGGDDDPDSIYILYATSSSTLAESATVSRIEDLYTYFNERK